MSADEWEWTDLEEIVDEGIAFAEAGDELVIYQRDNPSAYIASNAVVEVER